MDAVLESPGPQEERIGDRNMMEDGWEMDGKWMGDVWERDKNAIGT